MLIRKTLPTMLALGLLPLCSSAMAEEVHAKADGFISGEFAWLLGAVILGLCVIARRRPLPHSNQETSSEAAAPTATPKQWKPSGAAS